VVDYKTAATSDPDLLDRRVEAIGLQGASYALTVRRLDGRASRPGHVPLSDPNGAIERHLLTWRQAWPDVQRLMRREPRS